MISEDSTLHEVFEQKGEKAREILTPILGFSCPTCPLAQEEKLGEALAKHGLTPKEIKEIIEQLNS